MKSVITYTLNRCMRCLSCLRVCPTGAITKEKNRVKIDHKHCINCGKCLDVCDTKGLTAKGSTLADLANYKYNVVLINSNIYAMCNSKEALSELYGGLLALGFDRVIDLSDIEGALLKEAYKEASNSKDYLILGACEATNEWINLDYPLLSDKILYQHIAAEIKAKELRKEYDNEKLGIFLLCACPASLKISKYPYGGESLIDHSLSAVDLLPKISSLKIKYPYPISICKEGLYRSCAYLLKENMPEDVLVVDGDSKLKEVLELAEFKQLPKVKLIVPYFCDYGCIAGSLMWGNRYSAENNIRKLVKIADKEVAKLDKTDWYKEVKNQNRESLSMKEKIERLEKLNAIIEQLPNFNCGSCGYANCRKMAEEILAGHHTISDCKILNCRKENYED